MALRITDDFWKGEVSLKKKQIMELRKGNALKIGDVVMTMPHYKDRFQGIVVKHLAIDSPYVDDEILEVVVIRMANEDDPEELRIRKSDFQKSRILTINAAMSDIRKVSPKDLGNPMAEVKPSTMKRVMNFFTKKKK